MQSFLRYIRANANVAQLVEQLICNQPVVGSSPFIGSTGQRDCGGAQKSGRIPERSNGTDCKSVGLAFEGSNPSPPTHFAEVAHLVER